MRYQFVPTLHSKRQWQEAFAPSSVQSLPADGAPPLLVGVLENQSAAEL